MLLIQQFAIRKQLLYSGFVLPNVKIFFVQKISFATFGVSIDDFFARYAGLGYSLKCNAIYLLHSVHELELFNIYTLIYDPSFTYNPTTIQSCPDIHTRIGINF